VIIVAPILVVLAALYVVWQVRFRYPPATAARVLCYHKVSDRFLMEGTWITRRRFTGHVDHLARGGFRYVGENLYLSALDHPDGDHTHDVLLTFDDGYEGLGDLYRQVLEPRGVPLLVFLVTDYAGKDNDWDLSLGRRPFRHMDWDEIRDLTNLGVRFGSHGATHRDLTRLDSEKLEYEVSGSRRRIAEETGVTPRCFSYPFGRTNTAVKEAVRRAGYEAGFSLYPPHANETIDRFALRRNGVYIIDTRLSLSWKLIRSPFFWFEEMKCRAINQVAVLTPTFKRFHAGPDS
jgi:peptidoglycan/xylan/chitin deacetylase (PgdA/CDA1 family)